MIIPRKYFWSAIGLMLLPAAIGLLMLPHMPASVPIHYGLAGQPDAFGSPRTLVAWCAVPTIVLGALILVLPGLGPLRANLERCGVTYARIAVTVLVAVAAINAVLLLRAAGWGIPVSSTLMVLVGLMLAVLGGWLPRLRRNFWVGIRTPWTLANDRVWEMTHRRGAILMILYGLSVAAAGVFAPPVASVVVIVAGAVVLVTWSLAYSLLIYRRLGATDDI